MMFNERFIKLERIGAGGMGEVWRAYDKQTGATVALKEIHRGLSRRKDVIRFLREMSNLTDISHPNVVRLVASDPDAEQPAYAMEYCPKGDLYKWLRNEHSTEEKLLCFKQVCAGLEALHTHQRRMIHRDVKPSNVLLGEDSNFKISDFGLSVSLEDEADRVTTSNWVSRGFSAPEQFERMATVDERADIYSAGAILYFMHTGKDCSTPPNLDSPTLPLALRTVLKWMLAEAPDRRLPAISMAYKFYSRIKGARDIDDIEKCPQCGGPAFSGENVDGMYVECIVCDYSAFDLAITDD